MAEKRMFSKKIIDTDWFMDMPATTQNLYFHLSMRADDDGFVASPKRIIKLIGATEDDYRILIGKKFVIPFESGICVITDWRINNYLRCDRYTETIYKDEKASLIQDEKGKYELGIPSGIPLVSTVYSNSISKSLDNNNKEENKTKEEKHKHGEFGWVKLTDTEYKRLASEFSNIDEIIDGVDKYVQMTQNKNKYKDWNLVIRKAIREQWSCIMSSQKTFKRNYSERELNGLIQSVDEIEI